MLPEYRLSQGKTSEKPLESEERKYDSVNGRHAPRAKRPLAGLQPGAVPRAAERNGPLLRGKNEGKCFPSPDAGRRVELPRRSSSGLGRKRSDKTFLAAALVR